MDFVGPFVNVIDTYLIAPLARQINYLRNCNDNVNGLQTIVQNLKARRNDEQSKLKAQENSGQVKTDVASNWFNAVHGIEMEADVIEKEKDEGKCVNCWSRYKLSKRSVELKLKADQRLNEQFDVARPASPKSVKEIPTEPIMENQLSTERMLKQMLDCICDPDPRLGIIGLFGMGGVGKSTLAGKLNNHFKDSSCFQTVIMVTVSATPNIQTIHASIGKRLGLDLSKDSEDYAREKLFDALSKRKFLLILDDVWSKLELKVVGIPHPRNSKGSKILVISRNQDTCSVMGAKETIRVQPLSEAESWNLFVDKAGEHVASGDIKRFARKIVERCKGLPLAVVTVAKAMVNRHRVGSWEDALTEMERSAAKLQGIKEEVFVPLKFSFDRLQNDMLRSLFLYCACFPEDYNLDIEGDDMLNYCVGEGLVDELRSLKAARNKCDSLIESLKTGCMLEDGKDKRHVKMHDMMRELAIWITSSSLESGSSPKFLIKTRESFKEAPQSHEWVDATRISLIDTQIEELPELGERCPKLTTFLFRQNDILTIFPQTNFLEHMDHLSVLDLSYSRKLESLPDSLSCLLNLRVLRFSGCLMLRALPALGMLRRLQVLDLKHCLELDQKIILPEGSECVGGVSNLRYLNVKRSKVTIPVEVICRLHKLEELNLMEADNIKWRVSTSSASEDDENKYRDEDEHYSMISTNIDVGELSHLTYLTSLSISFKGVIISADWFKPPLANKFVKLKLKSCTVLEQDNALQALNKSQNLKLLCINDCPGVTCVPTDVVDGEVTILDCKDFETVVFDDGAAVVYHNQYSFERLTLVHLPKLKSICVGVAPLNCFNRLSHMIIVRCDRLKIIFTNGMPRLFNNLRILDVQNCERMEVIIEAEEGEEVISPFPRLERIHLRDLPALHDLCSNHILHCPLLNFVWVINCPRLKKDPLHMRNTDGLLVIEEEAQWWNGKVMKEEIRETRRE